MSRRQPVIDLLSDSSSDLSEEDMGAPNRNPPKDDIIDSSGSSEDELLKDFRLGLKRQREPMKKAIVTKKRRKSDFNPQFQAESNLSQWSTPIMHKNKKFTSQSLSSTPIVQSSQIIAEEDEIITSDEDDDWSPSPPSTADLEAIPTPNFRPLFSTPSHTTTSNQRSPPSASTPMFSTKHKSRLVTPMKMVRVEEDIESISDSESERSQSGSFPTPSHVFSTITSSPLLHRSPPRGTSVKPSPYTTKSVPFEMNMIQEDDIQEAEALPEPSTCLSPSPNQRILQVEAIDESSDEEESRGLFCTSIHDIDPIESPKRTTPPPPRPPRLSMNNNNSNSTSPFSPISVHTGNGATPTRRWLDSVRTPDKDTQSIDSDPRRKRKGPEVSRLHRLLEQKKTEEMAVQHMMANRQVNHVPNSTYCLIIQDGQVIGNMYKTYCIALSGDCSVRRVSVLFPIDKKAMFKLQPGVSLNLLPPWQEFTLASSLPVILCSSFEIRDEEHSKAAEWHDDTQTLSLLKPSVLLPVSAYPIHADTITTTANSPLLPHLLPPNYRNFNATSIMNKCLSVRGIVQRFLPRSSVKNEIDDVATLHDWFLGFSISNSDNLSRATHSYHPALIVQLFNDTESILEGNNHTDTSALQTITNGSENTQKKITILEIRVPPSLYAHWVPHLQALEGCSVEISDFSLDYRCKTLSPAVSTFLHTFASPISSDLSITYLTAQFGFQTECKTIIVTPNTTLMSPVINTDIDRNENNDNDGDVLMKDDDDEQIEPTTTECNNTLCKTMEMIEWKQARRVKSIYEARTNIHCSTRVNIFAAVFLSPIADQYRFNRSTPCNYLFLTDFMDQSNLCVRVEDNMLAELIQSEKTVSNIFQFRDVLVSVSAQHTKEFVVDEFSSVYRILGSAMMMSDTQEPPETFLPTKTIQSFAEQDERDMIERLMQHSEMNTVLLPSVETFVSEQGPLSTHTAVVVSGVIVDIILPPGETSFLRPCCPHCASPVYALALYPTLRSIMFCETCCRNMNKPELMYKAHVQVATTCKVLVELSHNDIVSLLEEDEEHNGRSTSLDVLRAKRVQLNCRWVHYDHVLGSHCLISLG